MNKKLLTTSVFLATSIAMAFEPWIGSSTPTPYYVNTGLDNGTNTAGYWFVKDDHDDGGESKVVWPVNVKTGADSLAPIIESYGGVYGTANLNKGTLTYNPFVSVGFNVVGEDAHGALQAGDASEWGGICITYRSDVAPSLELSMGVDTDASIGYALPAASLPKAKDGTKKCIPWSDFKQPSWHKEDISATDAAAKLVSINFKMQGSSGQYKFNICTIGPYYPKDLTMHPEISVSAEWSKGNNGYNATITVKDGKKEDGEKKLTEGTDYEIETSVNDATGIVIKTITGKGNYAGSVVKSLVPYIDENGEPQVMYDATVLTNNKDRVTELSGGWYVATGKVNMAGIKFNGEAHLILADDAEMVIETKGQSEHGIYASNNLTIYGQSNQNGILKATATGHYGIYSEEGNITISGGSVTATGNNFGIYGYNGVTISGSTVSATGNDCGIYSSRNITISDSKVTATGNNNGIYGYNGVTISGSTVEASGNCGIYSNGDIKISDGTVKATGYYGIYSYKGVTISGGSVTATGTNGDGICSEQGNITISGGTVEASGTNGSGIYGYNGVTISGGRVTATGEYEGIYSNSDITISGGTVEVTGEYGGIVSEEGIITLGWTNDTDRIKASSYYSGSVQIAEGKSLKDEKGNVYSGTLTKGQVSDLEGQKLEPFEGNIVSFVNNFGETSVVFAKIAIDGKDHVSAPAKHPIRTGYTFAGWFTATDGNTEFDFSAEITGNTTAYAHWNKNTTSVEYIDENGKTQILERGDYTVLTNDIYVEDLPEGWYVVEGEVKYTSTVLFSGNAHLILADGATMIVTGGIDANGNLTIYGQSNQNGTLNATATGKYYGFYSYEGVTISGGSVTVTGKYYGIIGSNITINGGTVTATGDCGIYVYSNSDITISGGTVEATGTNTNSFGIYSNSYITISGGSVMATSEYAGIYGFEGVTISGGSVTATGESDGISSNSDITISGGSVTATATGENGYGIRSFNGNITLGWTNSTDFIYASSYMSDNGSVQIAEGKSFKDEKGYYVYSGKLNAGQLSSLKGQKLEPFEGVSVSFVDNFNGTPVVFAQIAIDENGHVAAPEDPTYDGYKFLGWYTTADGDTKFDFEAPITTDMTAYAKWDAKYTITVVGEYLTVNKTEAVEGETVTLTVDYDGDYIIMIGANGMEFNLDDYAQLFNVQKSGNSISFDMRAVDITLRLAEKVGVEIAENIPYIDENGKTNICEKAEVIQSDYVISRGGWYVVEGDVTANLIMIYSELESIHIILKDNAKLTLAGVEDEGEVMSALILGNLSIYAQSIGDNVGSFIAEGVFVAKNLIVNGGSIQAKAIGAKELQPLITMNGGSVNANDAAIDQLTMNGGSLKVLDYTNSFDIAAGTYIADEDGIVYSGTLSKEQIATIGGKTLVPSSFKGKFLSDVNVAVADIPVQKYADGEPVCPSVVVTDGKDTLKAGTDYTVVCFNNTAVTSATLDEAAIAQITGKGNYAGAIQKRFFIWNNIRDYAAVQVFKDADGKAHAEINGEYEGTDAVAIDKDIAVESVKFNREFSVNLENGGFSTIMLPFDIKAENLTGVKSIFEFANIVKIDGMNTVGVNYVWCNATIGKQEEKKHPDRNCNKYSGELKAYTPYMVEMETPTLGINGNVTLKSSNNATNSVVSKSNWVFRGALQKKEWSKEDDDIKKGQIWAFAGSARNGASIGKFVQFGGNNWVNPFRAYLVDCTTYPDASECKDETQPEPSFVSRYRFADVLAPATSAENSLSAKTPTAVAASETALLNSMDIVIVYGDSASGERPTVIGRMNPATGEIRMLPRTKQTYDLKGRRVNSEKRNARGAYYGKHGRK